MANTLSRDMLIIFFKCVFCGNVPLVDVKAMSSSHWFLQSCCTQLAELQKNKWILKLQINSLVENHVVGQNVVKLWNTRLEVFYECIFCIFIVYLPDINKDHVRHVYTNIMSNKFKQCIVFEIYFCVFI